MRSLDRILNGTLGEVPEEVVAIRLNEPDRAVAEIGDPPFQAPSSPPQNSTPLGRDLNHGYHRLFFGSRDSTVDLDPQTAGSSRRRPRRNSKRPILETRRLVAESRRLSRERTFQKYRKQVRGLSDTSFHTPRMHTRSKGPVREMPFVQPRTLERLFK